MNAISDSGKILEVISLSQHFGGLTALSDINISVNAGEIVGIIGPNGAGKSTLFNVITGMYAPSEGTVKLNGTDISGWKPYQITEKGLARTFQNIRLFPRMTVLENVLLGMHCRRRTRLWQSILSTRKKREDDELCRQKALKLLKTMKLNGKELSMPDSLPYGEQRRLEIARALAAQPQLLLLDEPAAGMNEKETAELLEIIKLLRNSGFAILLIEHDMKFVMNVCERLYVLDHGDQIASGTPEQIRSNPLVIEAYLGVEE